MILSQCHPAENGQQPKECVKNRKNRSIPLLNIITKVGILPQFFSNLKFRSMYLHEIKHTHKNTKTIHTHQHSISYLMRSI